MERLLTVVTPAASRALTTMSGALAALGLDAADAGNLAPLIPQASAAIATHLGRTLARETVQETFRLAEPAPHLWLERTPVATVTSITEDGIALAADEWEADLPSGLLYRVDGDDRIAWQARRVVVVYAGGWVLPGAAGADLPADIEMACHVALTAAYQARGRDPRLRSETADGIGGQSWLDPRAEHGSLPAQAAELLAPHRRPTL